MKQSPHLNIFYILCLIIFLNMITMYSCNLLGCYELTFRNIFRLDLICNTCVDISFNVYKYQKDAYLVISGIILKTFTDLISNTLSQIEN